MIKFRIYDKYNKKLFSHEDILGMKFYLSYVDGETIDTSLYQFLLQYQGEDCQTNYIIQQFIGLQDKHGTDVYVGDLVNFTIPKLHHGPDREDYEKQEVIFDPEIASFAFGPDSMTILADRIDPKSLEIVGNIHE